MNEKEKSKKSGRRSQNGHEAHRRAIVAKLPWVKPVRDRFGLRTVASARVAPTARTLGLFRKTPLEPAWIKDFRAAPPNSAASFAKILRWPRLTVLGVLSAACRLVFWQNRAAL